MKVATKLVIIASRLLILYNIFSSDDWRCDQYRLKNEGVTKLPRGDPVSYSENIFCGR